MRTHIFRVLTVLWAVSAPAQPAGAPPPAAKPSSVTASAEAVVYATPDLVRLQIAVTTQAATAQAAASRNAAQLQSALDKLRAALGAKGSIRTVGYSLHPDYEYPKPGSPPVIAGYNAVNAVEATTEDLAGLGKLIDAVSQAGATNIQQLEFTLKDEKPARAEALRRASLDARANAEAMASALGLKLGRVLSLEQGGPQMVRPMMAMAAGVSAQTPIEEGRIEIRANVALTVALE